MQITSRKTVLFSTSIITLVLAFLILRPWSGVVGYRISYLREEAVELASAIDSRSSIRLREEWWSEHIAVVVEASKPREKPVRIRVEYTRLVAPSPTPINEVVKGRPDRSFETFRKAAVYFNSTHLVVDPRPVVEYAKAVEYGRTVHVVKITLFTVVGQLEPGVILYYNTSSTTIYERTYDYSGSSTITIGGQEVLSFTVGEDDLLRIIVVREQWIAQ